MKSCFKQITYFDTLDSSNDYLINLYKHLHFEDVLTVYVDKQMRGRGRVSKSWFSNDKGLTFSFSVKLEYKKPPFDITMLISISIVEFLRKMNIVSYVKYPNDIIVDNRKIAGILTETISVKKRKYAIFGIGFNINQSTFPKKILNAVSLHQLTSSLYNKEQIFKSLISKIIFFIDVYLNNKIQIKKLYFSNLLGAQDYVCCLFQEKKIFIKILSFTTEGMMSIKMKGDSSVISVNNRDIKFLLS